MKRCLNEKKEEEGEEKKQTTKKPRYTHVYQWGIKTFYLINTLLTPV